MAQTIKEWLVANMNYKEGQVRTEYAPSFDVEIQKVSLPSMSETGFLQLSIGDAQPIMEFRSY